MKPARPQAVLSYPTRDAQHSGLAERLNGRMTAPGELAQLQLVLPWELPTWFRELSTRLPLLGSRLDVAFDDQAGARRPVIVLSALQMRDEALLFEPGRMLAPQGIVVLAACGRRSRSLVVLGMHGPLAMRIGLSAGTAIADSTAIGWSELTINEWLASAAPAEGPRKPRQRFPAPTKPRRQVQRKPVAASMRCERSLPLFAEPTVSP